MIVRGWAELERLQVGDEARVSATITHDLIASTAKLTGDDNPLHLDADAAARYGQSQPIAHGQILVGMLSRLIGTELPGPGSVWFESQLRFLAPVYADDTVTLVARVAQVSTGSRVVLLDVTAASSRGVDVLSGQAKVRVPAPVIKAEPSMNRDAQVAIVTGGSRGLGRVIAETLGERGWAVTVAYRQDKASADAAVAAVHAKGGRALAIAGDLAQAGSAASIVADTEQAFGRLDVIVHAATPKIEPRTCLDTDEAELRSFFDTYAVGLHGLVRAAAPGMQARRFGRVIAILSSATAEVPPKLAAYVTGKYALLGLCKALAVELGPSNITVNCISPGMLVSEYSDRAGIAAREIVARKTPLRRLGEPLEVARAVAFLAGEDAGFISGANLPVSGGVFVA